MTGSMARAKLLVVLRRFAKTIGMVLVAACAASAALGLPVAAITATWDDQFRTFDLDRVKAALRSPVIVDLRNIYRPADLAAKGLIYVSVGRG